VNAGAGRALDPSIGYSPPPGIPSLQKTAPPEGEPAMRSIQTLLASSLLLLATACGGSSPDQLIDQGADALSNDPKAALAEYDAALSKIDETNPRYVEAMLGKYQGQCYHDATAAKDGFLAFAKKHQLQANDYRLQVDTLASAAEYQARTGLKEDEDAGKRTIEVAVALLAEGQKSFPDYDKWEQLGKNVRKKAASLGAGPGAMKMLEGLGYVGDVEGD